MKKTGQVFFKDKFVGSISQTTEKSFQFEYLNEAHSSVSWTLPKEKLKYDSEELFPFFDGLIPEGWLLNLASKNWKISPKDRMGLLLTICSDCIGAAHVGPTLEKVPLAPDIQKNLSSNFKSDRCLICCEELSNSENHAHAHCAKKLYDSAETPSIQLDLQNLEFIAKKMIQNYGALPGVQKKLSLGISTHKKKSRLTVNGLDGRFVLKPPTEDYPEMPQIEHISMKLAKLVGLEVAECGLIPMQDGELAYITKRFDRNSVGKGKTVKVQMEDFCQLSLKPTDKKYTGSTESLAKVIDEFSGQPQDDKLTLFQMILFSFWIGNSDMHLKNFSLWMDPKSQSVRMAPGYDFLSTRLLISKKDDNEELALPVNGKKNRLKWADFVALGDSLKVPQKVQVRARDRMLERLRDCENLILKSFLSSEKQEAYIKLLCTHAKRLTG